MKTMVNRQWKPTALVRLLDWCWLAVCALTVAGWIVVPPWMVRHYGSLCGYVVTCFLIPAVLIFVGVTRHRIRLRLAPKQSMVNHKFYPWLTLAGLLALFIHGFILSW